MSYDIDYLTLLSQQYPTVKAASTEIIRLQSRQKLPKLTEHFMSDIHGEYESFLHILKNASGVIKDKFTVVRCPNVTDRFSPLLFIIRSKSLNISRTKWTILTIGTKSLYIAL